MSVHARLLLPGNGRTQNSEYAIEDQIRFHQDDVFFGQIIDLSDRRGNNSEIPEKPFIALEKMTGMQTICMPDGKVHAGNEDSGFWFGRAGDFKKIDGSKSSNKNRAILAYLKELDPMDPVIVHVSW